MNQEWVNDSMHERDSVKAVAIGGARKDKYNPSRLSLPLKLSKINFNEKLKQETSHLHQDFKGSWD